MSKRQRRKREKLRRHDPRERPDRLAIQLATGAGVTVGATLLMGGVAQAACTCTVDSLADPIDPGHTTLRDAITSANANPGSTVTFASGLSGTITLGSQLTVSVPTTITGPGAGQLTVSGNDASRVFYVNTATGDDVSISGLTIAHGSAPLSTGGGIYSVGADFALNDAVVTASSANTGGGVGGNIGSLTIQRSTVSGNTATSSWGGGVYTSSGSGDVGTIRNSTVSGNTGGYGGGIYFDYSSPATLDNSTVYGNTSRNSGGGVYHFGAYDGAPGLVVTGSTITHNTADRGGGLACYAATDNSHELTEPIVRNTIIFDNTADSAAAGPDLSCNFPTGATETPGTVPAAFSLIGAVAPATTLNQTGPNVLGQSPQLGPLADNGGLTKTQAPSPSSPVVDKGNSFGLSSDQRGVLRPIDFPAIPNTADGSDIGAVELQPSNAFKLGKLKRNKKKGTAKQVVILPLPDAGSVTIKGKGLKTKTRRVTGAAKLKLPVIAKGKKRRQEVRTGKVKLKAKVTYNATGNAAKTLKRKLKLLKLTG